MGEGGGGREDSSHVCSTAPPLPCQMEHRRASSNGVPGGRPRWSRRRCTGSGGCARPQRSALLSYPSCSTSRFIARVIDA
jgi:hypothetical protein